MLCTERSLVKHGNNVVVVKPLRCKCWGCDHCVHQRRRDLYFKAINGKPRIFLTLTMRPEPGATPDSQAAALVVHFRMLRQYLMRKLKRRSPTFLAVMEAHESGWPHLHILLRSGFIDHKIIRAWWEKNTGSFQIDIKLIKGPRMAANYVSKYIRKNPKGYEHVKRYWCSQDWDPKKEERPYSEGDEFEWWESVTSHPLALFRMALHDGAHCTWRGGELVIKRWDFAAQQRWGIGERR